MKCEIPTRHFFLQQTLKIDSSFCTEVDLYHHPPLLCSQGATNSVEPVSISVSLSVI